MRRVARRDEAAPRDRDAHEDDLSVNGGDHVHVAVAVNVVDHDHVQVNGK